MPADRSLPVSHAPRSLTGPVRDERGSAVVEFVLVGVLLVALFLGIAQLALALHVRNTLVAAAAEGARYGANADRVPADGAQRTRQIVSDALSASLVDDVEAGYEPVDGVRTVVVRVRATLPVIAFLGPSRALRVSAHALAEVPAG
ncbi:MAG: TadE/TadG family type IV pilus assembly protein [Motilibacteraceae bacterium]